MTTAANQPSASERGRARRLRASLQGPQNPRQRTLAFATIVNTAGTGLFQVAGTIFLVRSAHLRPSEVGVGLTLGGLAGLAAGVLLGEQADRRGARDVVMAAMALEAVAACLFLTVQNVAGLAIVSALAAIGRAGSSSGRGALIAQLADPGQSGRFRAYLRAVTNVGVAVGTVGAAFVLAVGTRTAFTAMLLLDAASFLAAAMLIARLPRVSSAREMEPCTQSEPSGRRWQALHDPPYLAFTAAVSVANLQYYVLTIALPIWVTFRTHAPRWTPAAVFLIAAVIVAALQVAATRSIVDPRSAARLMFRSGPVFAVAWILFALAAGPSLLVATMLLLLAVVLHSLAEVWQAAGAFELSFALADERSPGVYQGVFGLSVGVAETISPVVLIALCIGWGKPGWLALGVIVTVSGTACVVIENWTARRNAQRRGGQPDRPTELEEDRRPPVDTSNA